MPLSTTPGELLEACFPLRSAQHSTEHGLREFPGKRVLLARVIGAEQAMPADRVDRLMGEARPGLRKQLPALGQNFQAGVEREGAERHENRL